MNVRARDHHRSFTSPKTKCAAAERENAVLCSKKCELVSVCFERAVYAHTVSCVLDLLPVYCCCSAITTVAVVAVAALVCNV